MKTTKYFLECHKYAPELNKLHIVHKGKVVAILAAAGAKTIKEAKQKNGLLPLQKTGLFFTICREYPEGTTASKICGKDTKRGMGTNSQALQLKREFVARSGAGSVLNNGEIMPDPVITIKAELIG